MCHAYVITITGIIMVLAWFTLCATTCCYLILHVSILHEQPIPGPPGPPGPPGSNVRDMCTLCNHMHK